MKTDDIRKAFLEFFRSKGHEIVPSDSLVPSDDPTLLFTGAGMNQFKEKFLGRNITYRRAASSQKCLRTADLENVGRTSGHHTFFEMLGNFSFGDYFKKEAIEWAWEFFVDILKIERERLWVSVYRDDYEAYNIWKDAIKVSEEKIVKMSERENFWPSEAPTKGPNGPCGPCSEIFYDYGRDAGCGKDTCTPACDCGRFCEVWNLVFTQFDRRTDGVLKSLPNKNIDTGMGLERIASVMQRVRTNFEIDIFAPIVNEIKKSTVHSPQSTDKRAKINAIADHIRAVTFAVCDGVMPSNEERGYVVRKLIRRSMSHAKDIGINEIFLYKLVNVVADAMKAQYPEIRERRDDIAQVIKREEEGFLFIIRSQLPKVEEAFEKISGEKDRKKIAETAFNFYDTYGMPYDLLEEAARNFRIEIDKDIFEEFLEKQRMQSRSRTKIMPEIFSETFSKKVEALGLKTEFLGYEKAHARSKVAAVLEGGEVILDKTPFYGESGGQVGDWGRIETESGAMEVEDAKKIGDTIVHIGRMIRGKIERGQTAEVSINKDVRNRVMRNHTATHLLHAVLKKVLGEHVRQTGSLVDQDHLRFDFTHIKKMEPREVARVEEIVNDAVKKALIVKKEIKSLSDARKEGAVALFGEKYGNNVRVVSIGDMSKELCGGTHVNNTKEIGLFRITSESSIASGVRRIEALTGEAAKEWVEKQKEAQLLRLKAQTEKEEKKKALSRRLNEEAAALDTLIAKCKTIGHTKLITGIIEDMDMSGLRILSDKIRLKEKSALIILATKSQDKVSFIIVATEDIIEKDIKASGLAKELARLVDGSGGGRPDFAQGGGRKTAALEGALEKIGNAVKEKLS